MNQQFDWYKLSVLDQQKPNIEKFQAIVRASNITVTLDRVPTTYRKNLLQMFQKLSFKMKRQTQTLNLTTESLQSTKQETIEKIEQVEAGLQESKHQLNRMKATIIEKKRLAKKLKEKIDTLKKQATKTHFFCPLCQRQDFSSKQAFTFHMFSQHQQQNNQNQTQSLPNDSAHNDLKEFIMTLKDKEMQMMKMILSQKKLMDTQDLQRAYERQVHSHTIKNASQPQYLYGTNRNTSHKYPDSETYHDNGEKLQCEELKGDSQFLFFQKSAQYRNTIQKQEEQYSIRKAYEQQRKNNSGHPYYDIFTHLQQNRSETIDQANRPHHGLSHAKNSKQSSSLSHQGILERFSLRTQQQLLEQRQSNSGHGIQPLRMNPNHQQLQAESYNPSTSITDRLLETNKYSSKDSSVAGKESYGMSFYRQSAHKPSTNGLHNETGNSTSKKVITGFDNGNVYVFNSGPLIVDNSNGDSDYEDYFGQNQTHHHHNHRQPTQAQTKPKQQRFKSNYQNQQDEQSAFQHKRNGQIPYNEDDGVEDQEIKVNHASYSFVSRSSQQQISELISPQKEEISRRHEKSSEIVDLSEDSFSRRDFELSKDQQDQTINLSDLKLSKLEKKKQQQAHQAKQYQRQYPSRNQSQKDEDRRNFSKDKPNFILISEEKPFNAHPQTTNQDQRKLVALTQFQRKIEPLRPGAYNIIREQAYQPSYPNKNGLTEFYKKSLPQSYVSSQEKSADENDGESANKPMSPQDYFAKQMMYRQPNASNIQRSESHGTHSLDSGRSSNNKTDFSQYNRRQNPLKGNSSVQNEHESASSRGIRKSSSHKRISRHQQLEDSNPNGVLGQFLKGDYHKQGVVQIQNTQNHDSSPLDEFIN